ncbi:hypothetical protein BH11PAT4_BH11PAT4_1520 [soil metagenome]
MSRLTFSTLCLLAFSVGVWVGTPRHDNLFHTELVLTGIFVILFWLKLWQSKLGGLTGILVAASIGVCHVASFRARVPKLPNEVPINVTGVVCESPDNRDSGSLITVAATVQGKEVRILAHVPPYPRFAYGEKVTLAGIAKRVEPIEDFDYPLFLERRGITHSMQRAKLYRTGEADRSVVGYLFNARAVLEARVGNTIPEPEASLLNGILLGSRQQLSEELVAELRATGTSHIVAISGANITIVVELLVTLLPLYSLRAKRNATQAIGAVLSIATGASASVVRGSIAAGLASTVKAAGRPSIPTSLVLLPATCMIIYNPLYLTADPSFQLSFAAYTGIVFLAKPLQRILAIPLKLLPAALQGAAVETLAATVGTLPVSLATFGSVSWIGLIANPAVLWLLPAITTFGGLFLIAPVRLVSDITWFLLHSFLGIIHLFNKLA